jgi:hypothetical protein
VGCILGLAAPPSDSTDLNVAAQVVALLRVLTTTALVIVFVLGPGMVLRAHSSRALSLGFLPLPGLGVLALTGGGAWALGLLGWVHPRVVSAVVLLPLLACLGAALLRERQDAVLSPDEWRILLLVGGALGIAIARSLWSLAPPGELYVGTIYRTLEVSDRPDSRISFHVVELVANGNSPFGPVAHSYFFPYTFSDRGPLAGLASTPLILLSGGSPPAVVGTPPWLPFDPQGFMSYRLAMMTFASTAFLSTWTLTFGLAGRSAARFAVILAATSPFLVHEVWFTWPKLLAASFVLLAAVALLDRRWFASGLLVGTGYLFHPLALLSVPALGLLAVWPLVSARFSRPRIAPALTMLAGVAVCLVGWRLANGSHYSQNGFLNYISQAGSTNTLRGLPVTLGSWISDRVVSLANTLVPLRSFLLSSQDQEVNAVQACFPFCRGGSPAIVHFFYQYWTGVPFGLGIVFFPLLLQSLWRAFRRWPWGITATVIVPFLVFTVYWGGASTGMFREGLHAWVLTLIVVVAVQQRCARFGWLRSGGIRALLTLRPVEVLLVAMLPTIITLNRLWGTPYVLTDIVAVVTMIGLTGWFVATVWLE